MVVEVRRLDGLIGDRRCPQNGRLHGRRAAHVNQCLTSDQPGDDVPISGDLQVVVLAPSLFQRS
jgi:hypothetical protein